MRYVSASYPLTFQDEITTLARYRMVANCRIPKQGCTEEMSCVNELGGARCDAVGIGRKVAGSIPVGVIGIFY